MKSILLPINMKNNFLPHVVEFGIIEALKGIVIYPTSLLGRNFSFGSLYQILFYFYC